MRTHSEVLPKNSLITWRCHRWLCRARNQRLAALAAVTLCLFSLKVTPAESRTWRVNEAGTGDAPTIQAAIDSATTGDEVLVAPGSYTWPSFGPGTRMLRVKPGLALRSEAGPSTTFIGPTPAPGGCCSDPFSGLDCPDPGGYLIEGFTFGAPENDPWGSVRAEVGARPTIRNCVFPNPATIVPTIACHAGVIEGCRFIPSTTHSAHLIECDSTTISNCIFEDGSALTGDIIRCNNSTITDCTFRNIVETSAGGVIHALGSTLIQRCLFANRGFTSPDDPLHGDIFAAGSCRIWECTFFRGRILGSSLYFRGCTLMNVALPWARISMNNCLLFEPHCPYMVVGSCNDSYPPCSSEGSNNIAMDPQFCATNPFEAQSASLQSDSPCALGNHPGGADCGQIGAGSVDCGPTTVRVILWSEVKSLYR